MNQNPIYINQTDSASPFWKWKAIDLQQRKPESKLSTVTEFFSEKGRKLNDVVLGSGVSAGVGCGVGLGLGVVGGAGLGGSGWNQLSAVFGIGMGCGVGLGLGWGLGRGSVQASASSPLNLIYPRGRGNRSQRDGSLFRSESSVLSD